MFSFVYIAIGPILIMAGAIVLFYGFTRNWKREINLETSKKNSHVIECEKCSKKLRVPTVKGTLKVTCPQCKHEFNHG